MNYLLFICGEGESTAEEDAVMQRETPGWVEEMDGRGVRLLGRRLDLPDTAATVRVRDGETLVTDGPFAETKEYLAGFDLLDCADLDEAIEVAAKHPVSWFHAIEIRPFADGVRLGEGASAFARADDSAGTPYMLIAWAHATRDGETVGPDARAWRRDVAARGAHVVGGALRDGDTATTVRVRDGETLLGDGPFLGAEELVRAVDVVSCADRREAIGLAAAHPDAHAHAIEVRPFWSA